MMTNEQINAALEQAFKKLPAELGFESFQISNDTDSDGDPMIVATLRLAALRPLSGQRFSEVIQIANDALVAGGDNRFVMISLDAPPTQKLRGN
jgi:hypothetical protein